MAQNSFTVRTRSDTIPASINANIKSAARFPRELLPQRRPLRRGLPDDRIAERQQGRGSRFSRRTLPPILHLTQERQRGRVSHGGLINHKPIRTGQERLKGQLP